MSRATGALGISVGTSSALEAGGLTSLGRTDSIQFNLRTLFRNAQESYTPEEKEYHDVEQLQKDVEGDITFLAKWIEKHRNGKPVKMVVYYPSYKGLKSKFPHADLKDIKKGTERQKAIHDTCIKVCDAIAKKYEKLIIRTDVGMPAFTGNGIVMTHHPVDLCEVSGIGRLKLLESHTGALKPYTEWNTKLTGGSKLYNIPLNRLTIQIFGDRSVDFMASKPAIRELVKKIAEDNNWTTASSVSRIRSTISNLNQGVDRAGLLMMM